MTDRYVDIFDAALDDVLDFGKADASHIDGCSCASCNDGKDFAPGGGGGPVFADTVPGGTGSTVTITPGSLLQGTIEDATDSDWYAITLVAGQTYTFSTILNTLSDSILTLRDGAGAQIATNDDAGGGQLFSEIRFTATSSGTFFLDVTGFGGDTGTFFITSTAPVADTIADSAATTASLTIGAAGTSGALQANGDHDWYAVTLVAGERYVFNTSTTGGANIDTTLMLRNASGALVAYNDDVGPGNTLSQIRFTATASGTFYLDVGAWGNSESGGYVVAAAIAPPLTTFTNDQIATQLTNTYWGGQSRHWNVAPGGTITVNITALTAPAQILARVALNLWTDVTGITFSEVATGGQLTFDDNEAGAFASSTTSGGFITSSQINVSESWLTSSGSTLRSYTFQAYIHEIGHALGLGHAGPYNGSASYSQDASYLNDSWATTVMSYFDQTENTFFSGQGFSRQVVVTPLVADIIAATNLYGQATTTRAEGGTRYGVGNTTGRSAYDATAADTPLTITIVDHGGGGDEINYEIYSADQLINLNPETFSNVGGRTGNLTIARGTIIENVVGGSGNDTLIGNEVGNRMFGRAGINTVFGNGGDDTIDVRADGSGSFIDGGEGFDTLGIAGTVTLGSLAGIENLGIGGNLILTGSQFANGLSATTRFTGDGTVTVNMDVSGNFISKSFIYVPLPPGGPVVFEVSFIVNGTTGTDIFKLGNFAHTVNAGDGADQIKGGNAVDTLNGGNGIDKINGAGGADILTGGAGNDVFKYANVSDSGIGAASDRITDFAIGGDKLNFGKIDTNLALAGDQGFAFVGNATFATNGTAQIRYTNSGADLLVQADVNGDGVADMEIILQGLAGQTMTAGDFVL
jgi:serralysin